MGRVCINLEQRQACEIILRENQAIVQDSFAENSIVAHIEIPIDYVADVLCPINGDLMLLKAYNGYDRLYRLTLTSRVENKKAWLKEVEKTFQPIGTGELSKIEVIGF